MPNDFNDFCYEVCSYFPSNCRLSLQSYYYTRQCNALRDSSTDTAAANTKLFISPDLLPSTSPDVNPDQYKNWEPDVAKSDINISTFCCCCRRTEFIAFSCFPSREIQKYNLWQYFIHPSPLLFICSPLSSIPHISYLIPPLTSTSTPL